MLKPQFLNFRLLPHLVVGGHICFSTVQFQLSQNMKPREMKQNMTYWKESNERETYKTERQESPKGLVTNYGEGGLQNGRGGAREVLPL